MSTDSNNNNNDSDNRYNIVSYRLYKTAFAKFACDFLILVEMRGYQECTDDYNNNSNYDLVQEQLTPEQANVIYEASRTLEKYGLDEQVIMKTFENPWY